MRLRLHVTSYNGGSDKNCMCGDWFFYILYNFTYWIQTAWRKLKSDQNWSPYLTGAAAVFQVHQRSLRKFSEDKMQEWWEVGYTAQYLIRLLDVVNPLIFKKAKGVGGFRVQTLRL